MIYVLIALLTFDAMGLAGLFVGHRVVRFMVRN